MTSFAEILHNIADHAETLLHLIDDQTVAPDIVERLKKHMILEEEENTAKLLHLQETDKSVLVQKALDHSYVLKRMMQEETMADQIKRELLDHFMEEHQEWMAQMKPEINTKFWTVGPLWPKGG